jgi:hypothetical protein
LVFLRLKKSTLGISTVIGGVIIIAIIFTVITPLFFYMNTVNNLYDNISTEMRDLDLQRDWEDVDVLAWAEEGERYIYVKNKGPLATNIYRVWVIPETPHDPYVKSFSDIIVKPGETIAINDPDINSNITALPDATSYFLKIATKRGNIFISSFVSQIFAPGYDHPLVIVASSNVSKSSGIYTIRLEIWNQMGSEFIVDYVAITSITRTGANTQVRVKPDEGVYGWYFPAGTPENPVIHVHIINTTLQGNPDSLKVELVSPGNFVIGAFYFISVTE